MVTLAQTWLGSVAEKQTGQLEVALQPTARLVISTLIRLPSVAAVIMVVRFTRKVYVQEGEHVEEEPQPEEVRRHTTLVDAAAFLPCCIAVRLSSRSRRRKRQPLPRAVMQALLVFLLFKQRFFGALWSPGEVVCDTNPDPIRLPVFDSEHCSESRRGGRNALRNNQDKRFM